MRQQADDLWTADLPAHRMLGIELGARMTVLRLPDGALWVHSPIALEPALRAEVDALGPIAHLVCPNAFHHVYAAAWAKAYPEARVHAPERLRRKRPDLRIDETLSLASGAAFGDALVAVPFEGCALHETVFVHPASRTLVSADLLENFGTSAHWPTRMYLKSTGLEHHVGLSWMLRVFYRDHRAARRSFDRILEHDFERVIIAHGAVLEGGDPKAVLRETYAFLRG